MSPEDYRDADDHEAQSSALGFLLKGKTTPFQRDLLQLARRAHRDENDPGFAVPLSMGQIEHVLEVYPERIRAAMEEISQQQEVKWERIQGELRVSAIKSTQTTTRMTSTLTDAQLAMDRQLSRAAEVMQAEREATVKIMADERNEIRQLLADERDAMLRRSLELTEQQKEVFESHTRQLLAKGVTNWKDMVTDQVDEIIKRIRVKHYWQMVAFACLVALTLSGVSWSSGWSSSNRAQAASVWGDIERWNRQELIACQQVNRATCNFHIEVPKE